MPFSGSINPIMGGSIRAVGDTERKLRAEAAIEAERTGVYTAPTKAQIDAHIEKGLKAWRAKHKK